MVYSAAEPQKQDQEEDNKPKDFSVPALQQVMQVQVQDKEEYHSYLPKKTPRVLPQQVVRLVSFKRHKATLHPSQLQLVQADSSEIWAQQQHQLPL